MRAKDASVDAALGRLMDPNRLDRAKRIDSKDVEVTRDGDLILARIKEYRVELDPATKTILHDCEDWSSRLIKREFCKHVGRVFLGMAPQVATDRLDRIRADRKSWRFDVPSEA